jgi:hypothetical protein
MNTLNYKKNNNIYNTNNYIFYINTLNYIFKSLKNDGFSSIAIIVFLKFINDNNNNNKFPKFINY